MTQAEIGQELVWSGLGDWNRPADTIKEYEAYGDGKVSMVKVGADGTTTFLTGDTKPKVLWEGHPEDDEELQELLSKFGHRV